MRSGTSQCFIIDYFTNGTMGDEKVVVEKMEMGTLHGGLFTGIGLGQILSKMTRTATSETMLPKSRNCKSSSTSRSPNIPP